MKKKYLTGLLSTLVMCNVAHAQNSVTLYGIIDEGLDITSNAGGHRGYQMVSGDAAGSRFGLKGSEDLGSGLKAVFLLENGFNTNTGGMNQGGLLFGRQAFVGLSSAQYGTVTMGRQYDPTIDMWSVGFTAAGNWEGDLGAHPYDNDNADWDDHMQNSIKYVSPTVGGFTGEALYAFSNDTGFANNRAYSAAAQYQMGPFSAVVAYLLSDNGGATLGGAIPSNTTVFTASKQQNIDGGLSYKFGDKAIVSLAYSHVDVYNPTGNLYFATQPAAGSQDSWKFDNIEINGQYFFRHDFWLGAAYTFTHGHISTVTGSSDPNWNQLSLMLDYELSARTSVYVQGAYQHADGKTGQDFDYASIIGSPSQSSTGNQMMYRIAMTHLF